MRELVTMSMGGCARVGVMRGKAVACIVCIDRTAIASASGRRIQFQGTDALDGGYGYALNSPINDGHTRHMQKCVVLLC